MFCHWGVITVKWGFNYLGIFTFFVDEEISKGLIALHIFDSSTFGRNNFCQYSILGTKSQKQIKMKGVF
jgi:hypothetical protein